MKTKKVSLKELQGEDREIELTKEEEAIVNSVLGGEKAVLFATEEERQQFRYGMPPAIINMWSENNHIAVVKVNPDLEEEIKEEINNLSFPEGSDLLNNILREELDDLLYVPDPNTPTYKIVSLSEHLALNQTRYLKAWANHIGLYRYLEQMQVPFHPNTDMLALGFLLHEVLPKLKQPEVVTARTGIDLTKLR